MHNANQLWVGFQGHSTVAVGVLLESAILPCNAYAYKKKGEGEIAREVIEKKKDLLTVACLDIFCASSEAPQSFFRQNHSHT